MDKRPRRDSGRRKDVYVASSVLAWLIRVCIIVAVIKAIVEVLWCLIR